MSTDTIDPSETLYLQKLHRRVILHAIKDLGGKPGKNFTDARRYVDSDRFIAHQSSAEYPDELQDSLQQMTALSGVERKHVSRAVLAMLETVWRY